MSYSEGGVGAGQNFGSIDVVNRSATACAWRGGVSVVPLTNAELFIPHTVALSTTFPAILLSARGHFVAAGQPQNDHVAFIILGGDARDDGQAANGLCTPANEVTPGYWGVATEGAKFAVANHDSRPVPNSSYVHGVTACRGNFDEIAVEALP